MLYKPSNPYFNKENIIDATEKNTYNVQMNVRGSLVYGYAMTFYKDGEIYYEDPQMIEFEEPIQDGETASISIPANTLKNDGEYEASIRAYNRKKGISNDDTIITENARIKGSDHSVIWLKLDPKDEKLESKINELVLTFKAENKQGYDLKKEYATILVTSALDKYSEMVQYDTIDLLCSLDTITNLDYAINTILQERYQEILDNIKFDRYINIEVLENEYNKTLIITPEEVNDGLEMPKTNVFTQRCKITWTEQYGDWMYIELEISGTDKECQGLTYMLADQTPFNIYQVSGNNTVTSFFVDPDVANNTVTLNDYVLFYDTAEKALLSHTNGDVPGSVYTVTPMFKNAYKIISTNVTTGECTIDGNFPSAPKIGWIPRFFTYDSIADTYTEKKVGKHGNETKYYAPAGTEYFGLDGSFDEKYIYNYYDTPSSTTVSGELHPDIKDYTYNSNYTKYGPKIKKYINSELYILKDAITSKKYITISSPTSFTLQNRKWKNAYTDDLGWSIITSEGSYVLQYSLDDGTTWTNVGVSGVTLTATQQTDGYYRILLRGTGTEYISDSEYDNHLLFKGTNITIKGNLDYLMDYTATSITHTSQYYCSGLFRENTGLTDASEIIYPTSTTAECFRRMFYGCTNLQSKPKTYTTYLSAEEAINNVNTNTATMIVRAIPSNDSAPYTDVYYTDGDIAGKFNALTDKTLGVVIIDGKYYIYENLEEIRETIAYTFRTYASAFTSTTYSTVETILSKLYSDIVPVAGSQTLIKQPYEKDPVVYYDSRCKYKKGTLSLYTGTLLSNTVGRLEGYVNNSSTVNNNYYFKVQTDIEVPHYTPYYKDAECTIKLGVTPRYTTKTGQRLTPYLGTVNIDDTTTGYIKLTPKVKVPSGTQLFYDVNLSSFAKTLTYNEVGETSRALRSKFYIDLRNKSLTGYIEAVVNDVGDIIAINSSYIDKKEMGVKDTFAHLTTNTMGLTQIRYGSGRYLGMSATKAYTSQDAVTWTEISGITNPTMIYSFEDILIVLADKIYVSYNGDKWESINYAATDVAYTMGMVHFLVGKKIYSTTNYSDFTVMEMEIEPIGLGGNGYGLYVFHDTGYAYITQQGVYQKTISGLIPSTFKFYCQANGDVIVASNTSTITIHDFGDTPYDIKSTVTVLPHNNYNEFVNGIHNDNVNMAFINYGRGSDVFSYKGVKSKVVDYKTLLSNDKYHNNFTTMYLHGPITCKDGYIAGSTDSYKILTQKISVLDTKYNGYGEGNYAKCYSIFFNTPQTNVITSGNLYQDFEKTIVLKEITSTDNYTYKFMGMETSMVFDSEHNLKGYCDTPITNPMITGTSLYSDMDFMDYVGKYEPESLVKCFVDIKQLTDVVPLATSSSHSGTVICYNNGRFTVMDNSTDYGGVLNYFMDNGTTTKIEGLHTTYNNKIYEAMGNWKLIVNSKEVTPTVTYKVLEEKTDGTYVYHEIDTPTTCIAQSIVDFPYIYTTTSALKYQGVEKLYKETTDVIFHADYDFILQNGKYRKANVRYKDTRNAKYDTTYYLNGGNWEYYNDNFASTFIDIEGYSKYVYIPIPPSGTISTNLPVYNVKIGLNYQPVKGYVYINGILYRIASSGILEDITLAYIDEKVYEEQKVGGNKIDVDQDMLVESNNDERLFITPNVNIKEDYTNPMQIYFSNNEQFNVEKLEEIGSEVYIIKNSGEIPRDGNDNIYPGCKYTIKTSFIDQEPYLRFKCESKPDVSITAEEVFPGYKFTCNIRVDRYQNIGPRTYEWKVYNTNTLELLYEETNYNDPNLYINSFSEGRYSISCNDIFLKNSIEISRDRSEQELAVITGDCLGYKLTPHSNAPHIYKMEGEYEEGKIMTYVGEYVVEKFHIVDYNVKFETQYTYIFMGDTDMILCKPEIIHNDNFSIMNTAGDYFNFKYKYTIGSVSLNINRILSDTLSKYGNITSTDRDYCSGSLTSLLDSKEEYSETINQLMEWQEFSTSDEKFLYKTPKGEKYIIRITESPTHTVDDVSSIRQTSIDFKWAEIESEESDFIITEKMKYGLKFEGSGKVGLVDGWKGEGLLQTSEDGITWEDWSGLSEVDVPVYIRGINNTGSYGSTFYTTKEVDLSGNIDLLLNYEEEYTTSCDCHELFKGAKIVDASEFSLGTYLNSSYNNYESMFENCTHLTALPEFKADETHKGCYKNMFKNCTAITWSSSGKEFMLPSNKGDALFEGCGYNQDAIMPTTGIPIEGTYYAYVPTKNKEFIAFISENEFSVLLNQYQWYGEGTLEYSYDGTTWTAWDYTELQSVGPKKYNNNYEVYIRGYGNSNTTNSIFVFNINSGTIDMTGRLNYLNLNSNNNISNCSKLFKGQPLKDLSNFYINVDGGTRQEETFSGCSFLKYPPHVICDDGGVGANAFKKWFYNCSVLTTTPDFDAPLESIGASAFDGAFYNCQKIVEVDSNMMSFTSMNNGGCNEMFMYCASIQEIPVFSVSSIPEKGCNYMFYGCTSLADFPTVTFDEVSDYGCYQMFYKCTSLDNISITIEEAGDYACFNMFYECTSLTTPATLSFSAVGDNTCYGMYLGCSLLTDGGSPVFTSIDQYGCGHMYYDCSSLSMGLPNLSGVTSIGESACGYMFHNCTALQSFETLGARTLSKSCYSNMFYGCSNLTAVPVISATTLAIECCRSMFAYSGVTSTPTSILDGDYLVSRCYYSMFEGCTNLVSTFSEITCSSTEGYNALYGMFANCTALETAPTIKGQSLETPMMFYGCTSLTTVPSFSETVTISDCANMFYNCTSLVVAPAFPVCTTIKNYGCASMFYNCTSLTSAFDMSNITSIGYYGCQEMYKNCSNITTPCNFKANVTLSDSTSLNSMFMNCTSIKWYTYGTSYSITTTSTIDIENMFDNTSNYLTMVGNTFHTNKTYYLLNSPNYITVTYPSSGNIGLTSVYHSFDGMNWYWNDGTTRAFTGNIYICGTGNSEARVKIDGALSSVSGDTRALSGDTTGNSLSKSIAYIFKDSTGLANSVGLNIAPFNVDNAYSYLFSDCSNMTAGPENLPSTISKSCYSYMFYGCRKMVTGPKQLPSTNVAEYCYDHMFSACSVFETMPTIKCTGLVEGCFARTFGGCNKMEGNAESFSFISNINIPDYALNETFMYCSNLSGEVSINGTIGKHGLHYAFYHTDITSLTFTSSSIDDYGCCSAFEYANLESNVGNIKITGPVGVHGCDSMFQSCKGLTGSVSLESADIGNYGYEDMFCNCEGITGITQLTPPISETVHPVGGIGCFGGMFFSCKGLTNLRSLYIQLTELKTNACRQMFAGTKLTHLPNLSLVTTLGPNCCYRMYHLVTPTNGVQAQPVMPSATSMASYCYNQMFLKVKFKDSTCLPTLPSTQLAEGCYEGMFEDSELYLSSYKFYPPTLPATVAKEACYKEMFKNTPIVWATSGASYTLPIQKEEEDWNTYMFLGNGGTIPEGTGTPKAKTTYYYTT